MQLVFKEGDFGVEQDRVWSGEFCEGDGVCGVVWIGVRPFPRVVVSGICRRVGPVVWLGCDGGGQWQARTRVCAGTRSEGRTCVHRGVSPAPQPGVRIADLDAAVALPELAALYARQRAAGVEGEFPRGGAVLEGEAVVSEGHLGEGEAERGLEGVALGCVGDGVGGGGDVPAEDVDRARVRRLCECVLGDHRRRGYSEFELLSSTYTMHESRPSTPAPPQDLWSSILDSVSSTRAIPSKQVLVLGPPASGKSLLASALLQKPIAADDSNDASRTDFALGYDWADVRDDADEGASVSSPTRFDLSSC